MLLTVFAYIPLIEEENARAGIELSKKNSETDGSGDADTDTEEGFGGNACLTSASRLKYFAAQRDHNFTQRSNHYDFRSFHRTSPPPEI